MYSYRTIKEYLWHADIGHYVSYGIVAYQGGVEVARISDVSVEGDSVKELARLCNEYQVSPIHLWDVVEDWIS